MNNKTGRPRKESKNLRVPKGFSLSIDNLQFIAGIAEKRNKKASEVLNSLLDNARKMVGE